VSALVTNPTHLVGIDVAKEVHVAAGIVPTGDIVFSARQVRMTRSDLESFAAYLSTQCPRATTQIGIEATGHYWIQLHRFLVGAGWHVVVFNPVHSGAAGRAHPRGRVTDNDDALTIARVLRDGVKPSQILSPQQEHCRELTRRRSLVAERRVEEIQHLQAAIEVLFPEFVLVMGRVEKSSSLAVLAVAPCADAILAMPRDQLAETITRASRGQSDGCRLAQELQAAAAASLAHGYREAGREALVAHVVRSLRQLDEELGRLDDALEPIVAALPQHQRLITDIPGFGPVTAAATIAEFGDLGRFVTVDAQGRRHVRAAAMLAFAGLDPRIRQSGRWTGTPRMSKRGSPHLRRAIMLAAVGAAQRDTWCGAIYRRYRRRCAVRGHWLAVSHIARHLVHAIAAMLGHGDAFTWQTYVERKKASTLPMAA
jgi:transposase